MMKKIILVIIIVLTMVACQKDLPNKDYIDFNHMEHWDELETLPDGEVLLFYYSPYCVISKSIEDEATEYFVILENAGTPIYLINEGFIFEQGEQPLEVIETPSLLIYNNQEFVEIISGAKPVTEYLSARVDS
ncbi:MAG: hypothetical protein AB7E16_05140, partial [Candidatus Izemoplasmatales bacterium]